MKELSQRYAHYFNKRYERTGTLWEGRFRSCVTESSRYVLACYRYIELNPVRAGMVMHPSQYVWSSYRTNSGRGTDSLVAPHSEFLALGIDLQSCRTAYEQMLADNLDASVLRAIREATSGGYPLSSEDFKASLVAPLARKLNRGRPGRRSGKSVPDPDLF